MTTRRKSDVPEPPLNSDELDYWKTCTTAALPDCFSVRRTPQYCAHMAAEIADAMVQELRARMKQ